MRYKTGDKVRIKTWKEMEKEYELDNDQIILRKFFYFTTEKEKELNALNTNRVLTIKWAIEHDYNNCYYMQELNYCWTEEMFKGYKKEVLDPILSRFEILDL